MECHPWFEVPDRRKIGFRNVQIKVLLVFEQGRSLQVLTSLDNFDQFGPVSTSFNKFQPVSTSLDQFGPVLTSLDWFISLLITSKIQYFRGGSLLLPTSVLWDATFWNFHFILTRSLRSVLRSNFETLTSKCFRWLWKDCWPSWYKTIFNTICWVTGLINQVSDGPNIILMDWKWTSGLLAVNTIFFHFFKGFLQRILKK